MRILKTALIAAVSLSLLGCETNPDGETFCGRQPITCVSVGALAVVGVLLVAALADGGGAAIVYSDLRLKRDVHPAGTLPNGANLYAFRYWNDDRTFIGVVAQDLLKDARFRHAVSRGEGGYYLVDLNALGLGIAGDAAQFQEAGRRALEAAEAGR